MSHTVHGHRILLDQDRCIDAFSTEKMVLSKPRWAADGSAETCVTCRSKFTQLKRKHHCRQCGQVYCSSCCKSKAELHHLGYTQPERVCSGCVPIVELISNALSSHLNESLPAVESLMKLCKEEGEIHPFVELGCLHTIIHAARTKNLQLRAHVVTGLHRLVSHDLSLQPIIIETGATKLLFSILSGPESSLPLLVDSLSLLTTLCAEPSAMLQALSAGMLDSVLPLCVSPEATLALPALRCLCRITQHAQSHTAIVDCAKRNTVTRLMSLLTSRDERIQEVLLHILCNLSSAKEQSRDKIIQEDIFNGNYLAKFLKSRPADMQVLRNAACLVANLAASRTIQGGFRDELLALCQLVSDFPRHEAMMVHTARGIANFAQFQQNATSLLPHLPSLINSLLISTNHEIRYQILRVCVALLKHTPEACINMLDGSGSTAVLAAFSQDAAVVRLLERQMAATVPSISSLEN